MAFVNYQYYLNKTQTTVERLDNAREELDKRIERTENVDDRLLFRRNITKLDIGGLGESVTIARFNSPSRRNERKFLSMLWQAMNMAETDRETLNAYLSFLYNMMPRYQKEFVDILEFSNCSVELIDYPGDKEAIDIMFPRHMREGVVLFKTYDLLVLLGLAIIVPFKQTKVINFEKFYINRVVALSAKVGGSAKSIQVPFNLEVVTCIREQLQGFDCFKEFLIEYVVSDQIRSVALLRHMATYVTDIIEWTDLTGFGMVVHYLVETGSPVLVDGHIAEERLRLVNALEEAATCRYPPFYRYLGNPDKLNLFERIKFPILIAVAQSLAQKKAPSMVQFATPKNVNPEVVQLLVDRHEAAMRGTAVIEKRLGKFLPQVEDPVLQSLKMSAADPTYTPEYLEKMNALAALKMKILNSGQPI